MTGPAADRPPTAPGAAAADPDAAGPWQRLDRRMLLINPVQSVMRFLPAVAGGAVLGASSGNPLWALLGPLIVVPYGVALWFTTTYRIGPTHLELRTGVIQRKRLSVPRARIRSVDIEADPLHRLLGLATVVVGTGREAAADDRFTLDALAAERVGPLRAELLAHTRERRVTADSSRTDSATGQAIDTGTVHEVDIAVSHETDTPAHRAGDTTENHTPQLAAHRPVNTFGNSEFGAVSGYPDDDVPGREIGHWRAGWVRYAPLSLTGFAFAASALGVAAQFGAADIRIGSDTVNSVRELGPALLVVAGVVVLAALVVVVSVAACAHYLVTYFGLRVTEYGSTLQIRRGLFTLRRITLDAARLRGATVLEPALLRLAGAAQLEAVMTGENPQQKILPQAPRTAVDRTLAELLRIRRDHLDPEAAAHASLSTPAGIPLVAHGPAARRRRHVRAGWPAALILVALTVGAATGRQIAVWWWLLPLVVVALCALLAEDRYSGLGHAVVPAADGAPTWLVIRSGSLDRHQCFLEGPGIIGWTVQQTFWQRRSGLATLSAATAAGAKVYAIPDIPLELVRSVIDEVTPGM